MWMTDDAGPSAEDCFAIGSALQATNKPGEAVTHFERALALRPDFADAHNGIGVALDALGRRVKAVAYFQAAIGFSPGYVDAHTNLGNAFAALRHDDEALAAFRKAVDLDPARADTRYNLGTMLHRLGRDEEAVEEFRRGLAVWPDHPETHNNLGVALHALQRHAEAIEHYRRAIALQPGLPDPYNNVGKLLMELGLLDAAQAAFASALVLAPERGSFYFNLAHVKRFAAGDMHLAAMEKLLERSETLPDEDRIALRFALAKAYADIGAHESSFRHLIEGNAHKRRLTVYDEAATIGELERIRRIFDADTLRRLGGTGNPSEVPVFIVGMPRSGTTLVEQILASHPDVHGAGELYDLDRMVRALESGGRGFPEIVVEMTGARLRDFGTGYLAAITAKNPAARRITDKMPWNTRFLGLIRLTLPNARVIHVRRDPIDTCLSCFSKLFTKNQEFSYDLVELGRYYRAHAALMDHWRTVLPTDFMTEIVYEALVDDCEGQARRIRRALRPRLERCLPGLPKKHPTGAHRQRGAGASADLSHCHRSMASLSCPGQAFAGGPGRRVKAAGHRRLK